MNFPESQDIAAICGRQTSGASEWLQPDLRTLLYGVINALPELVYFKSPDGIYLGCNKAFEEYWGIPERDLVGKTDAELMVDVEFSCTQDRPIPGQGESQISEEWVNHQDGRRVCLQLVKAPCAGLNGKPLGVIGMVRDITERKRLEEELCLSSLAYRHCSESMMVTDADNCIVAVNPAFTRVTGYSETEVLGKNPRILQSGLQNKAFYQGMWKEIRDAGHWQGEIWNRRKNGEIYPEWLTIDMVRSGDVSSIRYVALFSDITEKKRIEGALSESEDRFRDIFESAPIGMAVTSPDGRFIQVNQALCEMLGYGKTELEKMVDADITFQEDLESCLRKGKMLLEGKQHSIRMEKRYLHKNGQILWARISTSLLRDTGGRPLFCITHIENVTEHKFLEEKMFQEKKFSEDIINTLPDIFYMLDEHGWFIRFNEHLARVTGYSPEELGQMAIMDMLDDDEKVTFAELMQGIFLDNGRLGVEAQLIGKHGRKVPYHFSGRCSMFHGRAYLVGLGRDISERKQQEEVLARRANLDCLTGLANRRHFLELAERELTRAQRYGSTTSLIMLDLDEFKSINDHNGHQAGDRVLEAFGEICRQLLRGADIVGRIGGEEFAILLPETDEQRAQEVAERLRQCIEQVVVEIGQGGMLHFTASLGVYTQVATEMDIDNLLDGADRALYEAKRTGRNRVCCVNSVDT